MKYMTIAIAFAGTLSATAAFAQSTPSALSVNPRPATRAVQIASNTTPVASPAGQPVAPSGQPLAGKTRAQVYQELVHAEKDGQFAYLYSTIYAGG
ncbi:MAG TPA: hypothetical protein VHV99_16440 [Paraburkholderia sp.]|jgi:hypothetical protein|nr:hypothetical protein [Paraburkholderia sp.]